MPDIKTIVLLCVLTTIICTLMLVALWWQNRRRFSGLGFLAWDFGFQTVGLLLVVLRGTIPEGCPSCSPTP